MSTNFFYLTHDILLLKERDAKKQRADREKQNERLGRRKERPRPALEVYFSTEKIASLAAAEYYASYA